MKTITTLMFFIATISAIGQNRTAWNADGVMTSANQLDTTSFPLEIGNKWFYGKYTLTSKSFIIKEITDTTSSGIRIVSVTSIYPNKTETSIENWSLQSDRFVCGGSDVYKMNLTKDSTYFSGSVYLAWKKMQYIFNGQTLQSQIYSTSYIAHSGSSYDEIRAALGLGVYVKLSKSYFGTILASSDSTFLIGTLIKKVLYGDSINTITSVESKIGSVYRYALQQSYPNPFNPITKIQYTLPNSIDVILSVYDLLGRKIIQLVNETQAVGTHTADFNASTLPSGIYFYRLQAGSFIETKRCTVAK